MFTKTPEHLKRVKSYIEVAIQDGYLEEFEKPGIGKSLIRFAELARNSRHDPLPAMQTALEGFDISYEADDVLNACLDPIYMMWSERKPSELNKLEYYANSLKNGQ